MFIAYILYHTGLDFKCFTERIDSDQEIAAIILYVCIWC